MRLFDGLAPAATQNGGTVDAQRRRPDPLRWIWYAFGGTLGQRYRQWVLQDLTGPTRWERQIARAVLQVAPLAVVLLLRTGVGADLLDCLLRPVRRAPSRQARIRSWHRSTDPQ